MNRIATLILGAVAVLCWAMPARALEVRAAVLRVDYPRLAPISRLDAVPDDLGFAGAELADQDNGTTGQFLDQTYETRTVAVPPEEADSALDALLDAGIGLIVVLAETTDLLRLAERAGDAALILNARARDVALVPGLALAHGPTRQKVTVTADVAAEPAEVWARIGNFQDLSWHPAVHSQTGEGGNEIDATRRLVLGQEGGPTIDELLYKYDADAMTYSYRITEVAVETLPVTNYSSHLTVMPRDGGGSTVEWRGAFYRGYPNNDPPPELNDEAAVAAVTGIYEAGLGALVETFGAPAS